MRYLVELRVLDFIIERRATDIYLTRMRKRSEVGYETA